MNNVNGQRCYRILRPVSVLSPLSSTFLIKSSPKNETTQAAYCFQPETSPSYETDNNKIPNNNTYNSNEEKWIQGGTCIYFFFLTVSRFETEKRKMIALFHRPHYVVYTSSVNICFKFSIYSRIRSFHNPMSKTNLHLAQLNTDDIHSSSALYTL